jgi:hypothetical protein
LILHGFGDYVEVPSGVGNLRVCCIEAPVDRVGEPTVNLLTLPPDEVYQSVKGDVVAYVNLRSESDKVRE